MGIHGLTKLLGDNAHECIKETKWGGARARAAALRCMRLPSAPHAATHRPRRALPPGQAPQPPSPHAPPPTLHAPARVMYYKTGLRTTLAARLLWTPACTSTSS
jgi:hypothetical protein